MNDSNSEQNAAHPSCKKHRIARLAVVTIFLVALRVVGATFVGKTWAGSSWKHRPDIASVENAQEHAKEMAAWITGTVDGSDLQGEHIDTILAELSGKLYPLVQQHRA